MEEWKEYKLGEVTIPVRDRIEASCLDSSSYISTENMLPNKSGVTLSSGVPAGNAIKFEKGDVLISNIRPYFKKIWRANKVGGCSADVICLRASSEVNPLFLYYLLSQNLFFDYVMQGAKGTKMPRGDKNQIMQWTISIPSITLQAKIASILSSLDDKIEINRRINENLEQQAQALFKSWFVDFELFRDQPFVESELGMIPQGWRIVTLDEMTSKFGTGLNPRKNFKLGEGNNYYVTIKNMGDNRIYLDDKCDKVNDEAIEKINKRAKLQTGDLLFSGIGTIGRVALITEDPQNWNTSESVFNMHPSEGISSEFLYILLLSDVFQKYVKLNAQGGVQQGIRMLSLKQYKMAIPDSKSLKSFDCIIKPIVAKIKNNDKQNDELSALRDTLLPRLMSGELKVQEIEESL